MNPKKTIQWMISESRSGISGIKIQNFRKQKIISESKKEREKCQKPSSFRGRFFLFPNNLKPYNEGEERKGI